MDNYKDDNLLLYSVEEKKVDAKQQKNREKALKKWMKKNPGKTIADWEYEQYALSNQSGRIYLSGDINESV